MRRVCHKHCTTTTHCTWQLAIPMALQRSHRNYCSVRLERKLFRDTTARCVTSNSGRYLAQTGVKSLFIAEVTQLGLSPRRSPTQHRGTVRFYSVPRHQALSNTRLKGRLENTCKLIPLQSFTVRRNFYHCHVA